MKNPRLGAFGAFVSRAMKLGDGSRLTDWRLQFSQLFDCVRNELASALKVRFGIEAAKREAEGSARAFPT